MEYKSRFYAALAIFLGLILVGTLVGCTTTGHAAGHSTTTHKHGTGLTPTLSPGKCINLGRYSSNKVAVSVDKDCINKGLTTVTVIILDKKKVKVAMKEGEQMMLTILGFNPKLVRIIQSKDKGMYVFLMAVVGVQP